MAARTDTASAIPEILVTGEKRETTVQTAPLAITAIDGDLLLQRNVNELDDLNGYVPGLTIVKSEGAERVIAIRGIGYETAQNPNTQPGVAFHIDGVYIAHVIALDQDLLDVDRVEVLRGPQGTVFGETSTGGAINVVTRKPVIGEASGTASLSYGTYDYLKAISTVNIPISDVLAARASVQYLRHDGYGGSIGVAGTKRYALDDADNLGYRGALLLKPTDGFTALLEGQGFSADRHAALQKNIDDTTAGARRVDQDYPGIFRLDTKMAYLTLTQEIGDVAMAKSVSSYQYLDKNQTSDNDRSASPSYFDTIVAWRDRSRTFTQEVSLFSTGRRRLEWTVGGFLLRQHASQFVVEVTDPAYAAVVLADGTGIKYSISSPFQHTSHAGYGNATLHLDDRIDLLAGGRYSYDRITAQPVTYDDAFGVTPPREAASHAVTGKIGIEYKPTPLAMLYVTASRGYKPTGLNFNSGSLRTPTSFGKETVDAVEIGSKNELFDRRLRLNLAGYYYWYRNFQYTAEDPVPNAGGTANIPRAEIYGVEAEATVLPMKGLRLDGTLSLARGRFKGDYYTIDAQTAAGIRNAAYANVVGYYNPYDPRVIAAVDAGRQNTNGNRVPKLPGMQAQGSVSYGWAMAGGTVTLRGDVIRRGHYIYRIFNDSALDRVPGYTIVNAFVQYQPARAPWTVSVSATNLFDRNGVNSRFSDPYGSGTTSVEYIDPRQVFMTIGFRW